MKRDFFDIAPMETSGNFIVKGRLVEIAARAITPVCITVSQGRIAAIEPLPPEQAVGLPYLLPGFIDAHVHIESSMLIPSEFARLAVVHGTVATVSDPHEIANVCGVDGVSFMIENGKKAAFKFNFGAPSCVPATGFETAGAALDADAVAALLQRDDVLYLSEMMNFPGVLLGDAEVLKKIDAAKVLDKPVDGHAPGLTGLMAQQYIDAGISTDHECFTYEEALDKLQRGMKVIIREGSAAKNFDALIPLMDDWYHQIMFCSDDKHPDSLEGGHINKLCARAIREGHDLFKVLQAACVNPVKHYKLNVGLLGIGDPADFVVAKDLTDFEILQTFINGTLVAESGLSLIARVLDESAVQMNRFDCRLMKAKDFELKTKGENPIPVIEAIDGQLVTNRLDLVPLVKEGLVVADRQRDILKIAVINRYFEAPVAVAFIRNFGLQKGALASSVAHDSHNIVVVGCEDEAMARAANLVISERGGISATDAVSTDKVLPLPVAGLMSNLDGYLVSGLYTDIDRFSKIELGSRLQSPFMTLSFMALLVIPKLKLSDKGLFDGESFSFIGT